MNILKKKYFAYIGYLTSISLSSLVSAGTMGTNIPTPSDRVYVGVFGGGTGISTGDISQKGTAFFSEANGGALAVNARGTSSNGSTWLVGGHVGFRWTSRVLDNISPQWTFSPATELEGYYLGSHTLSGVELNNGTTRLTEHIFHVKYPEKTGVFLVNAILNADSSSFEKLHPYIGVGVGMAVNAISGANSTQVDPYEGGINHYNSDPSDTALLYAAQPKVGVSFKFNKNTSMFAEYRFLYLSSADYTFGSTVYPTHVPTTNWNAKLGSQYYNMGTIGINYDL